MAAIPIDQKTFRRKLKELAQQQAETQALFSSIGQGAIATDKDGKISHINQPALDLLGQKKKDVIGKWFPETIQAEDSEGRPILPMDRPINLAFLTGKAVTKQMYYHHKNGTLIPVSVTVSPILLNDKPIGAVEVFRDITHELEIDMMKSEFIYLASHQLRTPLTAVKTYTHMLNEGYAGDLNDKQLEFTETILGSLERMNDIISTLLNISRIEAGKLSLVPAQTLLANIIDQSIMELQPAIRSKQLRVRTNVPQQKAILTDPLFVKEAFLNLLSNAIKYTPEKGIIKVSLRHTAKEQIITVQDNGYGVPNEAKKQLFAKFFRASNILNKQEGGTGLGLYLVKGITQALGGRVWFESEEGKGSTFSLALPFEPPPEAIINKE